MTKPSLEHLVEEVERNMAHQLRHYRTATTQEVKNYHAGQADALNWVHDMLTGGGRYPTDMVVDMLGGDK